MLPEYFMLMLIAPASVFGAVINNQNGINLRPTAGVSTDASSIFGITLFKGNASGPCNELSLEMAFDEAFVINSTTTSCFSTQQLATTCIGRRTKQDPGAVTTAQAYEAATGGIDTKAYQCTVTGFQQDGCPAYTGTEAQFHQDDATWSWDHETIIRDDFPGRMWSVMSFQMSCKP